jgi:hypothetical protein
VKRLGNYTSSSIDRPTCLNDTITHVPLVDVKKRKMRLYDVISVVCLLIAAATLAYLFGGAWLYRPQKVTDEFHKLFYNSV